MKTFGSTSRIVLAIATALFLAGCFSILPSGGGNTSVKDSPPPKFDNWGQHISDDLDNPAGNAH